MILTSRQLDILRIINSYHKENDYSPTLKEVSDRLGVSKVTVYEHVDKLIKLNMLTKVKYRMRSIELTDHAEAIIAENLTDRFDLQELSSTFKPLVEYNIRYNKRVILTVYGDKELANQLLQKFVDGSLVVDEADKFEESD